MKRTREPTCIAKNIIIHRVFLTPASLSLSPLTSCRGAATTRCYIFHQNAFVTVAFPTTTYDHTRIRVRDTDKPFLPCRRSTMRSRIDGDSGDESVSPRTRPRISLEETKTGHIRSMKAIDFLPKRDE